VKFAALRVALFADLGSPMDEPEYVEYYGVNFKGEVAYVDDADVVHVGQDPDAEEDDEREDLTHLLPNFPLEE